MAVSEPDRVEAPRLFDLDRCVHCGLCLNACRPTELGLEMDSPRGRVYQMVQVAEGRMTITPSYLEHIGLCLACRGCETACPSGVQYGRLIEAARSQIEAEVKRGSWSTCSVASCSNTFCVARDVEARGRDALPVRGERIAQAGAAHWPVEGVRRSGANRAADAVG